MGRIDIIGAGIGGLSLAIALKEVGLQTQIFEQAEAFKPLGAGIILANNAMQVYDKLGLRTAIEEKGQVISSLNITNEQLKPLSKMDLSYFKDKFKVNSIAIHRGVLQQLLVDQLDASKIYLNHKLEGLEVLPHAHKLWFEDQASRASPLVIGADGLNSVVRKFLFPEARIRLSKQVCWRGITKHQLPDPYKHALNEAWSTSARFGFVPIDKVHVYWYALKSYQRSKAEYSVDQLETYFEHFNPLISELIASTDKAQINTAEISDLKPMRTWYGNGCCLMGDAAHAATPNMGQGACQAIEDAYVLAHCMKNYAPQRAFEKFQQLRIKKALDVVQRSWRIGQMAHISNPIFSAIRNQLLQMMPTSLSQKQSNQLFTLPEI